jgi:hypothetical protein
MWPIGIENENGPFLLLIYRGQRLSLIQLKLGSVSEEISNVPATAGRGLPFIRIKQA